VPLTPALDGSAETIKAAAAIKGSAGALPHERLADVYSAADLSVLLSSREGWPNVLLESMACGTRVLATAVWGTPEVVTDPAAGRLLEDTDPAVVARAIAEELARPAERGAVRACAERHSWEHTAAGVQAVFEQAVADDLAAEPAR